MRERRCRTVITVQRDPETCWSRPFLTVALCALRRCVFTLALHPPQRPSAEKSRSPQVASQNGRRGRVARLIRAAPLRLYNKRELGHECRILSLNGVPGSALVVAS